MLLTTKTRKDKKIIMQIIQNQTKNVNEIKTFIDIAMYGSNQEALKYIKNTVKTIDEMIFREVSSDTWISNGFQKRGVFIPQLNMFATIERRWYKNRYTGEWKCLFDERYKLEKYKRFLPEFEFNLVKSALHMSLENVSEINNRKISPSTISKLITKSNYMIEVKSLRELTKILYINVDGIYINKHKANRKELKVAVMYTGWTGGKRSKLLERTVVPFPYGMGMEHILTHLEDIINIVYGNIEKVVIVGDGANWITTMANNMSYRVVKRYIDQFHYTKKCQDYVGKGIKIDFNYLRSLSIGSEAVVYLDSIRKPNLSDYKKKEFQSFISKWFKSYVACYNNKFINAIEAIQSHYIAPLFKYRRSFTRVSLIKLLKFVSAKCNDWDIVYMKKEYQKEWVPLKTFFDILESSQDEARIKDYQEYQENFPMLFCGHKITADAFRAIIHGSI